MNRTLLNARNVVLTLSLVLPACEGFVCSQERIKAIELANRGAEAFRNNLYDTAEKDLKQASQVDPSYEIAYYNLGKVYQKQRKWDKAAEAFEAAVQRSPKNANYQYDLGEAYLEAKKVDQAEKALQAATEADPKLFKAHWRLGLVYKMLDQPKPADEELRKAIEANPRFSKSYVALGYLYLDYDFNKEAQQVFQGCVTAKEDDGECHNGYGLALKNLKQYEQATSEFKKAIRRNGRANICRSSSPTAGRPPTGTTSRRRTTSCTPSRGRSGPADRGRPGQSTGHRSDQEPPWACPWSLLVFFCHAPACYKNSPIFYSVSHSYAAATGRASR